jgi:Tfp pilus assembly protein PilN
MRAVNLLPSDLQGTAVKASPRAGQEKADGIGAYVVLGALALCVAALAAFILTNHTVKQRQADLQTATERADAAASEAAALKPYADFQALAAARVATVRGLAAARFDWEQALRDMSRAMPGDVKLLTLNGDMGLPGATGTGGDPLRGAIQAPAITLTGCAPSQQGVARMMSRLKAVDGVTRVALSKSEKPGGGSSTTESPCGEGSPPSFSIVIFFERSKAAAELAPAAEASVPVPNAVNQASGAGSDSGQQAPGGQDGAAQPETDSAPSASTSTTTSTTTGGTP